VDSVSITATRVRAGFHLNLPWRHLAVALYIGVNLALVLALRPNTNHPDWQLWLSLPDKLANGTLYAQTGEARWVWSPVLAPLMAGATVFGYWAWAALHIAAVFLLRDWRLIAIVLVSWGFWIDVVGGNTFGFVFIAATLALRGSQWASLAFLALTILMPRPIQVPLALGLLWLQPSIRLPALGLFAVHAVVVLATGYADDWLGSMLAQSTLGAGNIGPTAVFGRAWLIVGIPLGIYLAWKRQWGWAGVAVSPYMLPAYWLMPWLEGQRRGPDLDVAEVARGKGREDPEIALVNEVPVRGHVGGT
jgi:hypothetical protein